MTDLLHGLDFDRAIAEAEGGQCLGPGSLTGREQWYSPDSCQTHKHLPEWHSDPALAVVLLEEMQRGITIRKVFADEWKCGILINSTSIHSHWKWSVTASNVLRSDRQRVAGLEARAGMSDVVAIAVWVMSIVSIIMSVMGIAEKLR